MCFRGAYYQFDCFQSEGFRFAILALRLARIVLFLAV